MTDTESRLATLEHFVTLLIMAHSTGELADAVQRKAYLTTPVDLATHPLAPKGLAKTKRGTKRELKVHDDLVQLAKATLEGGFRCAICNGPATCQGRYEDMEHIEPACDECCGHGCEDGHCDPLEGAGELRLATGLLVRTGERDKARADLKRLSLTHRS